MIIWCYGLLSGDMEWNLLTKDDGNVDKQRIINHLENDINVNREIQKE